MSKKKYNYLTNRYIQKMIFNDDNNCTEHNIYYFDGELKSSERYIYDNQKNLIEDILYVQDTLCRRYLYIYDKNGNKIVEKRFNSKDSLITEIHWKFDSLGNEIEWQSMINKGNRICKQISHYNKNGKRVLDYIFNPQGEIIEKNRYNYDSVGNLIEMLFIDTIKPARNLRFTYQYDCSGNKTEEKMYESDGKISKTVIYKYDNQNREIELYWIEDNGLNSSSIKKYDEYGNIIEYQNKSNYRKKYKRYFQYLYDTNGNWIEEKTYSVKRKCKKIQREIEYKN